MRTTVRIEDTLLERAKDLAAEKGRTLTSLIEEGLTLVLNSPVKSRHPRIELPISEARGGVLPGVDLTNSADLEDRMNE